MIQKDLQGNLWKCEIGTMSSGKTFRAYQQEIERLNNIINELEKWLLSEQKEYRNYLSTRPTNDSEYNSKFATQCGLAQVDVVLDKLKELKEK